MTKRWIQSGAALVGILAATATGALAAGGHAGHGNHGAPSAGMAALKRTLITVEHPRAMKLPALVGVDGKAFRPERLKGRWTVLFFGFTSCPDVCPTTLRALTGVAGNPGSGVGAGQTQIAFVSIDPKRDTPARLQQYLKAFDRRIVGLTGAPATIKAFSDAVGAAYQPTGGERFDHSTSLFVLDPQGRLAGILLRPTDPARLVADLKTLRQGTGGHGHGAHQH